MTNFHLVFWIVFLASSVNSDVHDSEDILHQLVWRMSTDIGEMLADVKTSIVSQEQQIQEQRQGFQQQLQQQQGFQQQLQQQQQGFQQQLQQIRQIQKQQQELKQQMEQQQQELKQQMEQQQIKLDQLLPAGCKTTAAGKEYTGTIATTETERICQRWDSQSPHEHGYTASDFPDATLAEAANYCRNPDHNDRPWCFTTDPKSVAEFCNVPFCQ